MLKIGITGGIGSGKTTACKQFAVLGIPTYYADAEAKRLMLQDKTLVDQIKKVFGKEAYLESGALNRKHISAIAFSNKSKLAILNALVHPAVGKDVLRWFSAQKNCPFALQEAALMYESGSYKKLDYIIAVTAPVDIRVARVMKRDGIREKEVLSRINNQMDEQEKVRRADFVIYNDPNHNLMQQVVHIYHQISVL
ncbi:MAG: dephospho-CoA kinase [Polaribacter sp.]|jgi:dephospho-CoA kinase